LELEHAKLPTVVAQMWSSGVSIAMQSKNGAPATTQARKRARGLPPHSCHSMSGLLAVVARVVRKYA